MTLLIPEFESCLFAFSQSPKINSDIGLERSTRTGGRLSQSPARPHYVPFRPGTDQGRAGQGTSEGTTDRS